MMKIFIDLNSSIEKSKMHLKYMEKKVDQQILIYTK